MTACPYVSRVLAEQLVRRCDPALLDDALRQIVERRRDLDFPWYPARVVCHDILGQTALVDLAGLRDAIADQGGDPAKVNPVVPTQLIVDHSLAVEAPGFDPDAFAKNRAIEDRRNADRFHFIEWTKRAFENVDVIPAGNGIMHQINLEKMSPVIQVRDGVAFPDTCVGADSHTPHVDALGVIAIGVGGLEAETVMLGRPSMMRLPDIVGVNLTGRRAEGITATDIVLALTEFLRRQKVVGAWLEFFGEGADSLTIGDRATISNMCPEYGATAAMFYIDQQTLDYLRLTTLQRPGAQGVPFFFVRVDRAGNISKRQSATDFHFSRVGGSCPLWNVYEAVTQPGRVLTQMAQMPDGRTYLWIARTVGAPEPAYGAPGKTFAIGLGCDIRHASRLVYSQGLNLADLSAATLIGAGCKVCERPACPQRAFPPIGRPLVIDPNRSAATPYPSAALQ